MANIPDSIIKTLLSDNISVFIHNLRLYLEELGIKKYVIWEISNNIAIPYISTINIEIPLCDILDLGYNNITCSDETPVCTLTDDIKIYKSFFLIHNGVLLSAISVCEETALTCRSFEEYAGLLSAKFYDLKINESRLELFAEYQKKIDFIKKASNILGFIDIENILANSLSFFMEVFESEAGIALLNDNPHIIGFSEDDMKQHILINGVSFFDFIKSVDKTEYVDYGIFSDKYLINNMFIIYEPKINLKVVIFNVNSSINPDKEFSEIIAHITSIAVENALNHAKELGLKLEETEMKTTADILNRFAHREILFSSGKLDIYGISCPAKQAGGDFLGLLADRGKIFICLADVCGKGYSAAVITVAISTMFEQYVLLKKQNPSDFARYLTSFLLEKKLEERFVTLFFCEISTRSKQMRYISLGHEPVFVKESDRVLKLDSSYMPAGISMEEYSDSVISLSDKSSVFIYSDGIIEYIDYGMLEKKFFDSSEAAKDFVSNLYEQLVKDKGNQMDDFTCIKIDIKG